MGVVYLPPQPGMGQNLGEGFSQGVSMFMKKELDRQQKLKTAQEQVKALGRIQTAKTREEAFAVLTEPGLVNNPQEMATALKIIDSLHPVKDLTPTLVEGYDPETGNPKKIAIRKGDEMKVNDPQFQQENKFTTTKPDGLVDFYGSGPQGDFRFLRRGKLAEKQPSEFTKQEVEFHEKRVADERAAQAAERQAKAQERAVSAAERANVKLDLDEYKTYEQAVISRLNTNKTVGKDGNFIIDFADQPDKMKQFNQAMTKYPELKKKYGSVPKAVNAAVSELEIGDKAPPKAVKEEPAPKKEKSMLEKLRSKSEQVSAPEAPRDPKVREKNKLYKINGKLYRWTGTGWLEENAD